LRASFQGEIPVRKRRGLHLRASGAAGAPLTLSVLDEKGNPAESVMSAVPLQTALKRPLTREVLLEHLGKLGGTPFEIASLEMMLDGDLILPVSELNRMRRALVEQLGHGSALAGNRTAGTLQSDPPEPVGLPAAHHDMPQVKPELFVLCRTHEQINAALEAKVARIYLDFEDIRLFPDAVARVRSHEGQTEIFLATPRIQKPGEAGYFKLIARAEPDGVLIRNLGAIDFFASAGLRMTGDFSLNVANPLSADFLMGSGLERLTVSYDLDIVQTIDLLRAAPPACFELTLHQHMPMFHMEHCVFAAFMSEGKSFLDCGRPCEKHAVKLRDRVGMEHPLKADVGCRNTLFNATPQTGAKFFGDLMQAGLRHYRVELLEEPAREAAQVIASYQALLRGTRDGGSLWRDLRAQSRLGVTSGTLGPDDKS
jgi:putative protease